MSRLSAAQRVVLVVAFGATCLATGTWVADTYAVPQVVGDFGWTGYAPLRDAGPFAATLTSTEMLLVWIGLAAIWALVSLWVLGRPRSSTTSSSRNDEP